MEYQEINKVSLDGNGNVVIQGVKDSKITINTIAWDDFVKKYTVEQHERIKELKERVEEQKQRINENKELAGLETLKLSNEINKFKKTILDKEKQVKEIIKRYEHKDLNIISECYKQAFNYFIDGDLAKALEELSKTKLDDEEKKLAEARTLKAKILQLQYKFDEAENNFLRAVNIFPSFDTYFQIGNFYQKLNRFDQAIDFYEKCLLENLKDDSKGLILNNLGLLYRAKHDFLNAEISYQKALDIYRKLSEFNKNYFKDVGKVLNDLANLQSDKNEMQI